MQGGQPQGCVGRAPYPAPLGSPRDAGEDFAVAAARLAGHAGIAFGWPPATFWAATPAELAALADALAGDAPAALGAGELGRLMKEHPDG